MSSVHDAFRKCEEGPCCPGGDWTACRECGKHIHHPDAPMWADHPVYGLCMRCRARQVIGEAAAC